MTRMKAPVIGMFCFLVLYGCNTQESREAMVSANVQAIKAAKEIDAHLAKYNECPREISGWEVTELSEGVEFGVFGGNNEFQFPLRIQCTQNLEFSIDVKYDFDSGTSVEGGIRKDMKIIYGHFTDTQYLVIEENSDAIALAKMVVYGR